MSEAYARRLSLGWGRGERDRGQVGLEVAIPNGAAEHLDDGGVEVSAGSLGDSGQGVRGGQPFAAAAGCHGLIGLGYGQDPRVERDVVGDERVRDAAPVPT